MKNKTVWILITIFLFIPLAFYTYGTIKDIHTVEKVAHTLFSYPLPPKTEEIDKYANYGLVYGGGPYGSGDQGTAVAFMKLTSELSEEELIDYYSDVQSFEIYFEGDERLMENRGKVWYEGSPSLIPSSQSNEGDPITLIVQIRTPFTSPLGEFVGF